VRIITKELALKIVKKLGAKVKIGKKAHDLAIVFHENKAIASFGIRRGSSRESGHDHVQQNLHLSPTKARLLAQCPMSAEEWLTMMRDKGLLP
jgi:hypothetical protein